MKSIKLGICIIFFILNGCVTSEIEEEEEVIEAAPLPPSSSLAPLPVYLSTQACCLQSVKTGLMVLGNIENYIFMTEYLTPLMNTLKAAHIPASIYSKYDPLSVKERLTIKKVIILKKVDWEQHYMSDGHYLDFQIIVDVYNGGSSELLGTFEAWKRLDYTKYSKHQAAELTAKNLLAQPDFIKALSY